MSRLFNRASGKWEIVPENEITSLVASGSHGFERGVQVPVVAPDGSVGTIAAEDVERAFKEEGYRWQTAEDMRQFELAENDRILDQHYNSAGNALGQGTLRGASFGTTDAVMPAIVDMLPESMTGGVTGEDIKTGLRETKNRSPIAAGIGQAGGALLGAGIAGAAIKGATAGVGVADALTGQVVAGAPRSLFQVGADLAAGTAARAGLTGKAATIVEGMATTAMGSAVEGAFFGIGDGISEAALGKPDEIAENLLTGVAGGALFGGAFGAAFGAGKVAAAPLKGLIAKATEELSYRSNQALRAGTGKAVSAVLSLQGEKELAGHVKDLTAEGSDRIRQIYFDEGAGAAAKAAKQIRALESEVRSNLKRRRKELKHFVDNAPKEIRDQLKEDFVGFTGDVTEMVKTSYGRYLGQRETLEAALRQDITPSKSYDSVENALMQTVNKLRGLTDTKALRTADALEEYIAAQRVTMPVRGGMTEGRELQIMNEVRDLARARFGKHSESGKTIVKNFIDDITDQMRSHPTYGEQVASLDRYHDSFEAVRKFVTGSIKQGKTKARSSILQEVVTNPAAAKEFDTIISNFAEVAPAAKAVADAGKDIQARNLALREMKKQIKGLQSRAFGHLDEDDFEEIATLFNSKDMLEKVGDVRELMQGLQDAGEGTFTKAIRLGKLLGKEIDPKTAHLAQFEGDFAKLDALMPQGVDEGYVKNLIAGLAQRGVRAGVGKAAGMVVGAGLGFEAGDSAGALVGGAIAGGMSPIRALKALTVLERKNNEAFKVLTKSLHGAVDALTSNGTRKVVNAAVATRALQDRRMDFKERAAMLDKLKDPDARLEFVEDRIGDLPGAPTVKAHLAMAVSRQVDFLQSKLPTDPLAANSLNAFKSSWEPSDYELAKFERYVDAAEDPNYVLGNIARGTATPEEIEALQAVYPQIYRRLQGGVMNAIMDPKANISYAQKVHIGTLLSIPTDYTLSPQFTASMQSRFVPDESGRPEGSTAGPAPRGSSMDINPTATQTNTQRITDR